LVLADFIYQDPHTRKNTIIGTFNALYATQFPFTYPRKTCAYICLTDLQGDTELSLRFVYLKEPDMPGMQTKVFTVSSKDPLQSVELIIPVPPFHIPKEGPYAFEILSGHTIIGSLRITAQKAKKQEA